jgi:hypothetical protein
MMAGRIPFVSICPTCKHSQVQWYMHSGLLRLLNDGQPVQAYCGICNECRRISVHERAELAARAVPNRSANWHSPNSEPWLDDHVLEA